MQFREEKTLERVQREIGGWGKMLSLVLRVQRDPIFLLMFSDFPFENWQ